MTNHELNAPIDGQHDRRIGARLAARRRRIITQRLAESADRDFIFVYFFFDDDGNRWWAWTRITSDGSFTMDEPFVARADAFGDAYRAAHELGVNVRP